MNAPAPFIRYKQQEPTLDLPRGNLFRRMLTAKAVAMIKKQSIDLTALEMWPNDRELHVAIKAASAPAMTSVPGWAAELAQRVVADTVSALGPYSAGAQLLGDALLLSWDGAGAIGVPGFVASANYASFVAEGDPIPVRQFANASKDVLPHKLASIAVLTREMMESSNAEALIGDTLIRSAGLALDAVLFGSAAASAAQPAGLRNGIAASTPSANADPYFAFFEDINTLISAVGQVGGRGPFYVIGSAGMVAGVFLRAGQNAIIIPLMTSAAGNDLIAVAANAVAAAFSPTPDMETANTGALVMDTAPGAAGSMGPERSLYQTDSLAIKMRWPVSWVLRDARGVAWLTPTWK
jgi:hypothetical protein